MTDNERSGGRVNVCCYSKLSVTLPEKSVIIHVREKRPVSTLVFGLKAGSENLRNITTQATHHIKTIR